MVDEAEAERRRKIVDRIAQQNGETPEEVEANAATPATHAETFEDKVLFRLGFIAWSTGIVALVVIVAVINFIASSSRY